MSIRWQLGIVWLCVAVGGRTAVADLVTGGPGLQGPYTVGLRIFDAVDPSRNDRTLTTWVWYPVDPDDAVGEPLRYRQLYRGQGGQVEAAWYESPFLGGTADTPVSSEGPFPHIVLSHGSGGFAQQF